ncbi:NADH-rubredoxin oxidoreductase [compost metagenome]
MQTNMDNIYAAGDVVQFKNKIEGLWNTAMEQGKIAGANMANDTAIYQSLIPMTVFTAFDMPLFSIGQIDKEPCQHPDCGSETVPYKQVFKENDAVCGAIVFDTVLAAAPYKEAIEQALPITTLMEV